MTPADKRFSKGDRLLRPAEFARVYDRRQSAAAGPIVLYAAARSPAVGPPRLGLSVSRRVGNAVVRNSWKRRLREAFRAVRSDLPAGSDMIIVVRSSTPPGGAEAAGRLAGLMVDLARRVASRAAYGQQVGRSSPERRRR